MLLSIIVFLFAITGCQEMKTSEVAGTWVMKEESRKLLIPEVENSTGQINVLTDGTFVAKELPYRGYFESGKYIDKWRVISGSGTWKFLDISGLQNLYLGFDKFSFEKAEDQSVSYGFPLVISKGWSKIGLYYDLSDPDMHMRVEFEKITQ